MVWNDEFDGKELDAAKWNMGQLHQHLVLFNHIDLDLHAVFLERIPHLREHFVHPVRVEGGVYSNYSRPRYAPYLLKAGGLVTFQRKRLRSTLGGAGVAVSSKTKHPQACMDFARFTAAPETQMGVYFQSGGQPGHRAAWTDSAVNEASNNFFRDTLQTLDESILTAKNAGQS